MSDEIVSRENTRLGFIGLGLMGSRFLRRLSSMGWSIRGWNRSVSAALPLRRAGIGIADSLPELARSTEVLFSSLANDDAVRAVYFAEDGVFANLRPGTILLEMSTISPDLSARLHEAAASRGAFMIDLPVSGSTPAVEAGTVTLFGGGQPEIFDRCIPLFQSIAKQWFWMGPATTGVRMKLVVNLLLGVNMAAIAEAVTLGQHLKLNRNILLDVLPKTAVIAPAFTGKFPRIKAGDYSPQFPLELMAKDMRLVLATALDASANLPATGTVKELLDEAVVENGTLDLSALVPWLSGRDSPELEAARKLETTA